MANEQTGGSTVRELMDEIKRLREKVSKYEMAALKEMMHASEAKKLRRMIPVLPYRELIREVEEPSEADATISTLTARIAELEAAHTAIIERSCNDPLGTSKVNDMREIARRAIGGKQ